MLAAATERSPKGSAGEPLVSIVVTTYNHERYIEKCLRSILMQKVSFPYEVLVGEDCSTDSTASVLRRLRPELPSGFQLFLRESNMGPVRNGEDLYARARGKYLASIEGDDFWTYDEKLQRQVDYLEAHPECSAVFTRCVVVGEDSMPNGERYPQCPRETYSFDEYFYSRMPGQTATMLCRRKEYFSARDEFFEHAEYTSYPGDRRNSFLFLCLGEVRCIQEEWSAYRHVVRRGSSSFSSNVRFDDRYARDEVLFGRALVEYARRHGSRKALRVAERTYWRLYLKWAADSRCSLKLADCLGALLRAPHRLSHLTAPLQWYGVLGMRALLGGAVDL